jgi:hypothetical protein
MPGLIGARDVFRRHWCLATMFSALLALQALSLAYYFREQTVLTAYINRVASPSLPPSEQIKGVVLSLKDKPDNGNDSYFLLPIFHFLRPTPWQVIEKGGDCADRSRLVIALMHLRGIQASKWALYDAQGESRHAVVQADVESGKMVVDPLFGIWFPKPEGGYYAIPELKQDSAILPQRISELRAKGLRPGVDRLETYRFDQYVYSNARTINWNKSAIFRISYSFLHRILGERVDDLRRPAFVEEPALMVVYGAAGFEVVIVLVWLVAERRRRRRTPRVPPN